MKDPKDILINGKQLSKILELHKKYVLNQVGGERADLSYADLSSADLSSAYLRNADLRNADLSSADLSSADLSNADLSSADLRSADLSNADLSYADLRYADLRSANLRSAKNAEIVFAITSILPEGDIVGWKKLSGGLIAKILIPAKAKRSNATGRKCRAEYAKVLEIWNGENPVKIGYSDHDNDFVYKVGKIVKPTDEFDENRWEECSTGIHFFITRVEAENY